MTKITDFNHALEHVTQSDVKFIRVSLYDVEKYDDIRLNVSLMFEPEAEEQFGHLYNSKCKNFLNLTTKLGPIWSLTRQSKHPAWRGLEEMYNWAQSEKAGKHVGDENFKPKVSVGKLGHVGKFGKRRTPEPAYYTAVALSILPDLDGTAKDDYYYCNVRIGEFRYDIELKHQTKDQHFSYIGQEECYHD